MANPFTPNFGEIPQHIAGRDDIIREIAGALREEQGNPARTSILIGARGSGKTALLSYFSKEALNYGWISVNVTCISGMQEDILQQTIAAARELLPKDKKNRVSGVSLGSLFSVSWEKETGIIPNWRTQISELLSSLAQYDTGLLITIDEVTPTLDEMIQVASVYQLLIREGHKISLLMAGLPSEISDLLNDRSVSFLRRASQYHLGRIEDYEIESAFLRTIEDSGKTIEESAVSNAVRAIDGFPYMMQLVGYRSYEASSAEQTISVSSVQRGIELAQKDFESRVLKAILQDLSAQDKAFLRAMLPDAEKSAVSAIEKRMKKSSGYVSRYRARLIESGVIEPSGRGYVKMALPGMTEFLKKEE